MAKKKQLSDGTSRKIGSVLWIYTGGGEDRGIVKEAIYRDKGEIAIDLHCADYHYTMVLRSKDGIDFSGECKGRCDGETWLPVVNFTHWTNPNGSLLFGTWIEDGDESYCTIELTS